MDIKQMVETGMDKQQLPGFTVTVTKMFDRKTGEGAYGPWSMQNALTKEGIMITFCNHEDLYNRMMGKTVEFIPIPGKKGPITPVISVSSRGDKTYRGVKVSGNCEFKIAGEQLGMESAPKQPEQVNAAAAQPQTLPTRQTGPIPLTEDRVREIVKQEIQAFYESQQTKDSGLPF